MSSWAEKVPGGYRGRYRDQNGSKPQVLQPDGTPFRRKSDAKDAAAEEKAKIRRQAVRDMSSLSAGITWGQWWEQIKGERERDDTDTFRTEEAIVRNHIMPWWGDEPLNKISRKSAQRWVRHKDGLKTRKGMSPGYAGRIFGVFRATIRQAVVEEVLTAYPLMDIELPKARKKRRAHFTETPKLGRLDYADAIALQLETGLRPGELAGMHADQLERDGTWLAVCNVYVYRKKVIRGWPKDEDTRKVPLTPKAMEVIGRRLDGRDLTAGCGVEHSDGERCASALVFLTERGKALNPDTVGKYLKRAGVNSGLYAGRRGFATRTRDSLGVYDLADIMGHSDIRTAAGYVQESDATRQKLIAALGQSEGLTVVSGHDHDSRGNPGAEVENQSESERTAKKRGNAG